jgi:hypothetical protein
MDEYEQYKRRIADITRDANFALWNALLTLNGIIISAFSVVAVFSPAAKAMAVIIIAVSMLSAGVLVFNFRSTRNQYRVIGQVNPESFARLTPQQREQQIEAAVREHNRCNTRETAAQSILAVQGVLILILVFLKP